MKMKKSILHFIQLIKERKFQEIIKISRYYFMDKVLLKGLKGCVYLTGKMFPPRKLHACPACGRSFPYFYPIVSGSHFSFNTQCPYCKSHERHRAQWLYYNEYTGLFQGRGSTVLHCEPEEIFFRKLYRNEGVDYYPVDKCEEYTVDGERMRDYVDLTELPYEDDKFDYILCNHVLEHIPDEKRALSELKRVLKPEGVAFLSVPIDFERANTLENPAYNTYVLRLKYYGQCDHVRLYGRDFQKRLENAGFHVNCIRIKDLYSKEDIWKYGLQETEEIYSCKKD